MALPPPSPDVLEHVRAEFGLDEERIKEAVTILKEWLQMQPHLPQNCDDARLERWIIRCKNSLERTKSSIDMYYTLKNVVPELLQERDPLSDCMQKTVPLGFCVALPKLTDDYSRVTIIGLFDSDPENFDIFAVWKGILMSLDVRMSEDYCSSDIFIVDFGKFKIGHVIKFTLPLLKKLQVIIFKGYNVRLKKAYIINCPPYAESLVSLGKSLLKSKLADRIRIFSKDLSTLAEEISPKVLPVEYGGENGCISDHWSAWVKKLESHQDWFLEQDKYKSDESKRPGKPVDSGDLFGMEGSFRQLNVD